MRDLRISLLDLLLFSLLLGGILLFSVYSGEELRAFLPSAKTVGLGLKALFVGGLLFGLTMITDWRKP